MGLIWERVFDSRSTYVLGLKCVKCGYMSQLAHIICPNCGYDGTEPWEDRVTVVRCKNCKRWRKLMLNQDGEGACVIHYGLVTPPDWFCHDGVRKENKDE